MDLSRWKSQLRKGAAELAVLAVLEPRERYGLDILEQIQSQGTLEIAEGTIYPLLNRLQRDGKVSSHWREDEGASHPRKYYTLTAEGRELLGAMIQEWNRFAAGLGRLVRAAGQQEPAS